MQICRAVAVPLALVGALGGAAALAAPTALAGSSQAPSTQQTHPSVRPKVGRRHTTFELTFRLVQAPRRVGLVATDYRAVVSPPAHARESCSPTQPATVFSGSQGATVKIPLRPTAHGWCTGRYDVTVFLQRQQLCGPPIAGPALIVCPVSPDIQRAFPELSTGQTHFTVR